MEKTPNLNLNKFSQDEDFDVDEFNNENVDILDAEVGQLKTDVEEIKQELEDGVGDYTAPTIANAPAITSISDTSAVPVSSSAGVLNRITWANFKAVLRSVFDLVYAPKSHASTSTDYGLSTASNYGHVKTVDNLTTTDTDLGKSLSARQGSVIKGLIDDIQNHIDEDTADNTKDAINSSPAVTTVGASDKFVKITSANGNLEHITFSNLVNILQLQIRNVTGGNDSNKPSSPTTGTLYIAYDTEKIYVCYTGGVWDLLNPIALDGDGILRYNGKPIIPINQSDIVFSTGVIACSDQKAGFTMISRQAGYLESFYYKNTNGSGTATTNFTIRTEAGEVSGISAALVSGTAVTLEIAPPLKVKKNEEIYLINRGNCFLTSSGQTIALRGSTGHLEVI